MKVISHLKDIMKYSIQYMCVTHCFFEYVGDFVVVSRNIILLNVYKYNNSINIKNRYNFLPIIFSYKSINAKYITKVWLCNKWFPQPLLI